MMHQRMKRVEERPLYRCFSTSVTGKRPDHRQRLAGQHCHCLHKGSTAACSHAPAMEREMATPYAEH